MHKHCVFAKMISHLQ